MSILSGINQWYIIMAPFVSAMIIVLYMIATSPEDDQEEEKRAWEFTMYAMFFAAIGMMLSVFIL